jgi:hypothetical protein
VPKVRRTSVPKGVLSHLYDRVRLREVSVDQLYLFLEWLELEPEVPVGQWFKRFPGMTVCGEGELVKTLLTPEQVPVGERMS